MLKGHEAPRVYTKPLRKLTRNTTLGYDVADFASEVLQITLNPWQRWLLIHALEIEGSFKKEWRFRFRTVVVLVGRQNGKTLLGAVLSLYFLYVARVGLILGTAQDLEQAEDTWRMCVEMAQAEPELAEQIDHVWHTNGAKRLTLVGGRDYRVKASTRKAGRGKAADLVLLDELREHQNWDAYAALSKTGMSKANALLWCMSNAGDGTSVVLRHFRLQGHLTAGDPDGLGRDAGREYLSDDSAQDSALGFFEWSAPPDADKNDKEAWAAANPSLGYTVTERAIRAACADDPEEVFKTECLCQWVTASVVSPFPADSWEKGTDNNSEIAPDSQLWWGVDVSADRGRASIGVCGIRSDGSYHIELVAYRGGVGWLQEWFIKHAAKQPITVALQGRGAPVSSFKEILAAVDNVSVVECVGSDVAGWAGRLWDAVAACGSDSKDVKPVYHRTQPALDLAANIAATKPLGDGAWAWDRTKSLEDISPLVACSMALGLATRTESTATSSYETQDLLIL